MIQSELTERYGVGPLAIGGSPLEDLVAGTAPLCSGAVLLPQWCGGSVGAPPLALVVRNGPASGTVVPLPRGTFRIGRSPSGPGPCIALADPALSRDHAVLEVTDTGVVLRDAGSANGTWLGGRRVRAAHLAVGEGFRIGASTCALAFSSEAPQIDPAAGGAPGETQTVPQNVPPSRRAALIAMAVLPLLLGIGMALATGTWMFLAFTAVSAVSILFPLAEARSARRDLQRRLRRAADDDADRRRRASPDAGLLARAQGSALPPAGAARSAAAMTGVPARQADGSPRAGAAGSPQSGHLRLGTADVPAAVVVTPPGPAAPMIRDAPVTVPVDSGIAVSGAAREAAGLLRFVLLQLALLPAFAGTRALVAGGPSSLRMTARFLPRVRVLPDSVILDPASLERAAAAAQEVVVVVVPGGGPAWGGPVAPHPQEALVRAAAERGWPLIGPSDAVGPGSGAEIRLRSGRAELVTFGTRTEFIPDLMPARAFETAARRAGLRGSDEGSAGLPERCALDDVVRLDADSIRAAWRRSASARGLAVILGMSASGPLAFDLVADGPHLLIAGTTGSGKSELLRSLIAGAASAHPPDRLTFLFVDFKGGSGLQPLAGLPHCVGLVTDLAAGDVDRTLASLRAELVRRERMLASVGAADLDDFARQGAAALPRLVLVVDEFRVLVDEAPAALAELMRIATVGRSLGMHLVMATQRPQGAVSSDIRANVTSSIALRMQDDVESSNVVGSPVAARIPVGLPGRAYLAVGTGPPVEFQAASLGIGAIRRARPRITVVPAEQWAARPAADGPGALPLSPADAAAPLVRTVAELWRSCGGGPMRRPVAAPLPDRVELPRLVGEAGTTIADRGGDAADPASSAGQGIVRLGIADLPHEQLTRELAWDPARQGHLALCGPPAAGTARTLESVAAQLAGSALERHLYVLDADGTLHFLRDHPRVGAHVDLADLVRAARVIARLCEESTARLHADPHARIPLVLVVSGWGSWISALRQSPHAAAEEALADIIRDGPPAGITLVAAGERELVSSRAFAGMRARVFFPCGAPEEARLAWPRLPAMLPVPGRGAAHGALAEPAPLVLQCYAAPDPALAAAGTASSRAQRRGSRPFRIEPLPAVADAAAIAAAGAESANGGTTPGPGPRLSLAIGLAGDEPRPLRLRLGPGDVLLVLGRPESGRSSLLRALEVMNPKVWFVGFRAGQRSHDWEGLLAELGGRLPSEAHTRRLPVVLADDADTLGPQENQLLAQLVEAGAAVVATAGYGAGLYARCPIALQTRSGGMGILIGPRGPADGDAFGVRIDALRPSPAGRAVAIVEGRPIEVQLGFSAEGDVTARDAGGRSGGSPQALAARRGEGWRQRPGRG
ncbi:FtsK/SpoIIIE domain-containing protein [Sinomonas flava]|uniref:FtsK/SpoIIIE domain-containing protein n=1 Tax=Sinomonas flava TaxID=496857 RepID=UPI0031DBB4AA